ncbi:MULTISPECIES: AraC family transcriptional regulator [unclassified Janthinobacterium]|uniref:AraC family transcriptional regulator n=1 Tax=unclassified Janthinobacterium TaxID=2610881 RepID=UPI00161DB55B|nr:MULTISPECIES: AraC family transcriptional regulator [unclassified Janthinobacterium]MBB5607052.1 AraC family transcriptional regulator [Janthinobacterium sp. S3T4]MBB5612778.1 AraC family transcriptional regulator [Janthinobacterium sp. S3M3]
MRETARIMALREGMATPLFDTQPIGQVSPSPSLLIETHKLPPGSWQSHTIAQQVLTMFLRPGAMLHAQENGPVQRIPLAARSLALSLRHCQESIQWLAPAHCISVTLDDAVMAQAAASLLDGHSFEAQPAPGIRDDMLAMLMHTLLLEQAKGYSSGRLFTDGIEQAMCARLVSRHGLRLPPASKPGGLPAWQMRRLTDYIQANLAQPIQLSDLAVCAAYSPAHFSRLFQASFQATPHQYLLQLRIAHAKPLLRQRQYSVIEISLLCGFTNPQHFSRTFHRLTGVTPGAYRRGAQTNA